MPTNRTNTRTPTRTFRLAICCPNVRLPGWISFCKTSKQRVCALCSQSRVVCQEKSALRKKKWRSTVKFSNLSIITYKKICSAPKSSPRGQVLETALVLILHRSKITLPNVTSFLNIGKVVSYHFLHCLRYIWPTRENFGTEKQRLG